MDNHCDDRRERVEVMVLLLDEGVNVWRPVQAIPMGGDLYEIPATVVVPADEKWQFQPGETVRCQHRRFSEGTEGLAAVESVE